MHRALIRMIVSLALAAGMTLTVAATATTSASAAPAVVTAAPDCSTQQSAYDAAVAKRHALKVKLERAKRHLKHAKRALRHAQATGHTAKAHRLAKKVRQLRKKVRSLKHRVAVADAQAKDARAALEACQGGGSNSPIQSLCDQGVPQEVCDGLAGLVPGGGLPSDVSFQQLCDAAPQFQPLCDAADSGGLPTDPTALTDLLAGLGGGPADFTSIQALCDAGVPQEVCDGLAGAAGGGVPSDLSLQQLCDAAPEAQPLCDAANSGGGLPTDPTALTTLLAPILVALGIPLPIP